MSPRDTGKALEEALGRGCFRIAPDRRESLERDLEMSADDLLRALVNYIKPHARCPVSNFQVGAAGVTAAGEVFLGVNLEYSQASLAQTVHAEQFLISWCRSSSSSPLITLAVSAPPCGHCRQFMREFDHEGELRLLIGSEPEVRGRALLPRAFTPKDLGVKEPFFLSEPAGESGSGLVEAARSAAYRSYTPYSGRKAGVSVKTADGRVFAGSSLENAAFNPSLPPFQAALVVCHAHGVDATRLEAVVLCQGTGLIDYADQTGMLAAALGVRPENVRVVTC